VAAAGAIVTPPPPVTQQERAAIVNATFLPFYTTSFRQSLEKTIFLNKILV
jgi:hypothetical protein